MLKKTVIACVVPVVFAIALYGGSEALKGRPGFCVSCHLDGGTPLHAEKNRLFMQDPPVNLAGLHRNKLKEFGCTACHSGHSAEARLKVALEEMTNTFSYFFRKFEEPKKLDAAFMPDASCELCHKELPRKPNRFHGITAHQPKVKAPCMVCHVAHARGRADYYFIDDGKLLGACKKCHANIPGRFEFAK